VNVSVERLKANLADVVGKLRAATLDIAAKTDGLTLKELEIGRE
jgi:hypothetical protein